MPVRQMSKYQYPNFEEKENKITGSLRIQSRKVRIFSKFAVIKRN